ncbi:unnamed protein product [Sphagnum jensenii]|uniref:CRAL-TRIO domain-containing protein n=1 Tax=Sphagnum jensenii TaxID=128206 RepID=A0ABP0VNM7_9BRYO
MWQVFRLCARLECGSCNQQLFMTRGWFAKNSNCVSVERMERLRHPKSFAVEVRDGEDERRPVHARKEAQTSLWNSIYHSLSSSFVNGWSESAVVKMWESRRSMPHGVAVWTSAQAEDIHEQTLLQLMRKSVVELDPLSKATEWCRRCNTEEVFTCYTEEHCPPTFHVASCILCVGGLTGIIVYALDKLIARYSYWYQWLLPCTKPMTLNASKSGSMATRWSNVNMWEDVWLIVEVTGILAKRLAKAFVVHVSTIFWGVWHMISPFVGKVTKEKITFVEDRALDIY